MESNGYASEPRVRSRQSLQLNFPTLSQSFSRPTQSKDLSNLGRSVSRPVQSRDSSPCPTQVFGRSSPCPTQVFGRSSPCPTQVLGRSSPCPTQDFGRSSPCPTQVFGRSSPCPTLVFGQSAASQESSQWFGRSLPTKDLFAQPKDLVQRPTLNFIRSSASRESSPGPQASITCAKNTSVLASRGHPTQIERMRSQGFASCGKLKITTDKDHKVYDFTADDLSDQGEIGHGNYGTVNKMYHEASGTVMAVKRIRSTIDEKDQKQLLMDLDVVMRSNECPYIVKFYGALFKEGDCWICMELMSISLDQFYRFVHGTLHQRIREDVLARITLATLHALNYLKESLKIIHRDVKPSNILLDTSGNIKMCDFGISGHLVDSVARTRDAGCRPYMAPERIDPKTFSQGYDVRSDVWSLGITLIEVSTGRFPYRKWHSIFDQLTQVVQGDPPHLDSVSDHFSPAFVDFVNTCLIKNYELRPKYIALLKHPFVRQSLLAEIDVAGYVSRVVNQRAAHRMSSSALYR